MQKIFYPKNENLLGIEGVQMNIRNGLISAIFSMIKIEPVENIITFLQDIQKDIFILADKNSDKAFKFQFLGLYIHYYIITKDYDNAYKYSLEASKYIYPDAELHFYSALNLIFDKQNKAECFKNTQEIIKILKYNQKLKIKNCIEIAVYNNHLNKFTENQTFLKLYIYFSKRALKKVSNKDEKRNKKGEILLTIQMVYYMLKKYYKSIGYGKLALKYLENEKSIINTFDAIAYSYYCLSKFEKALENYEKMVNYPNADKALVYMKIADCQHKMGKIELMKETVKKAYELGSEDTEVQKNINETYAEIERGDYDKK